MNEKFEQLIERAGQLIARIEAILPQPLSAPDWNASIAWRYRKRSSGHGALEPVRHVAAIRLADLKEIDAPEGKDPAQHAAVRAGPARQQRAADRCARHRQVVADQGLPATSTRRRACG